ncbi:C40 family peptidase [Acinetobacter sp. ANC 4636]
MKEKGEYDNVYDYKKNADGTYKLDKHGKKIPIRGFHGGKTYIWEVTQEINTHFNNGILKDNKEVNFSCSIKNENIVPIVSESIAPWMKIAIREAKQWKGKKEGEIGKIDNYHALVGWGKLYPTMVGTSRAWCASFVNYCLQEKGYQKWSPAPTASAVAHDKNFIQINKPIYGAIALYKTSHVCFVFATVYGNLKKFIRLGGNQGDELRCEERSIDGYKFYIPKSYKEISDKQERAKQMYLKDVEELGLSVSYDKNSSTR